MACITHHAASLVMKQVLCLHHIGCPDCIAGSTASMRSEPPQPQLPFTGQSHRASSGSSGTASSSQPATSHAASGPAIAGVSNSSSSSSSTQLGAASEQAQLSGRSQAGNASLLKPSHRAACIWSQCYACCHIMSHCAQDTSRLPSFA